jgi:N-acyl-L-homoserine lactone synthetase
MRTGTAIGLELQDDSQPAAPGLLDGFRFTVCATTDEVARALAVRRRVYVGAAGYDVPIPDAYDARSWLLAAEDTTSGRIVGTMRVTPRFAGTFESDEYFTLPDHLRCGDAVELSRFAILPEYRKSATFIPTVSLGLFMLVRSWLARVGARVMVICARPEKTWTYEWLRFERTGLTAPYGKLGNAPHELLACDFRRWCDARGDVAFRDHPFRDFFAGEHPEVVLPTEMPRLNLAADLDPGALAAVA